MLIHLKRSAGEDSTPSGRNSGLRQMVRSLFMDLKNTKTASTTSSDMRPKSLVNAMNKNVM